MGLLVSSQQNSRTPMLPWQFCFLQRRVLVSSTCKQCQEGRPYAPHLEHLDEGDSEVEVDGVAKVQSERHEEADRHDAQHVEPHGHSALHLHHMQHL